MPEKSDQLFRVKEKHFGKILLHFRRRLTLNSGFFRPEEHPAFLTETLRQQHGADLRAG